MRDWLAAQDVSQRDETLDEESARVWLLHRALVDDGSDAEGEGGEGGGGGGEGPELARAIAGAPDGVAQIGEAVDCEEPRFAVMAMVDLIAVLKRRIGGDGDGEGERRDEDGGGKTVEWREWAGAVRCVAEAVPAVLAVLVRKAGEGDVCGDAMAYAVTLVTFLVGEEAREAVETGHHRPGGREAWRRLVEAASRVEWLKVCMRLWKDNDLAAHVPGVDDRDECHGLGFLVTVFLDALVSAGGGGSGGGGVAALCGMGVWAVSFLSLRLYARGVGEDERVRIVGVLWVCVKFDPQFGARLVFEDTCAMQALCESARRVGDEEEEDGGSCMSEGDGRSVGADNSGVAGLGDVVMEAQGDQEGREAHAAMDDIEIVDFVGGDGAAIGGIGGAGAAAIPEDDAQGSACSVEDDDGEARRESEEREDGIGSADPEELVLAARRGSGVFAHVRLLAQAVRDAPGADMRRRRFLRRMAPRPWLWSAAERSAELVYSLAGYELALGDRCAEFIKAPCARNALSFLAWRTAEWLSVDTVQWPVSEGQLLSREQIFERVATVSRALCDASAVPLLAECAHGLASAGLEREQASNSDGGDDNFNGAENQRIDRLGGQNAQTTTKVLNVCEWCLASDTEEAPRLKACGGCREVFYCNEEHMRAHWKRHHKFACAGKAAKPFLGSLLIADARQNLRDRSSGEALGAVFVRDGIEALVSRYGSFLVSMGFALCVVEGDAGVVEVKALPRGQVVRDLLNKFKTCGAQDVGHVMVETCSRFNGAFGLAVVHDIEASNFKCSLYRASAPTGGPAPCCHSGCSGHDVICSSSFLATR